MLCHCYLHCIFICFADFTTVCLLFLQLAIPEFCILNSNLTPTLNLTPVCRCLSTILTEFDLHFMAFLFLRHRQCQRHSTNFVLVFCMVFIFCVLCNLVTGLHSSHLRYCHPAVNSSYRPITSDVIEQHQYCTMRPERTGRDFSDCGFEYTGTHYRTLDERSCRWRSPVNGWQSDTAWQQAADVRGDSCSSFSNRCDAYTGNHLSQSLVKRRAQFFNELPSSPHCWCCNVKPGLWSYVTVKYRVCTAWRLANMHWCLGVVMPTKLCVFSFVNLPLLSST